MKHDASRNARNNQQDLADPYRYQPNWQVQDIPLQQRI
jgi:hypothetical protein